METNNPGKLLNFLQTAQNDSRLNTWHLALISALIQLAHLQNEYRIIRVSRSRLMALSHINTIPTYHRYFKQIQDFGYIKYIPSYHPDFRSTAEFLAF